jgi:hypothetical protein
MLGSKKQHDFQYSEQDVRLSKAKQTWPMITTMDLLRIAIPHSSLAIRQSTLLELWRTAFSVLRTSTMVRSTGLVAMKQGSGVNLFKRFSAFGLRELAEPLIRDVRCVSQKASRVRRTKQLLRENPRPTWSSISSMRSWSRRSRGAFADAEQLHGHRYAQLPGLVAVTCQCLLAAAQYIKKNRNGVGFSPYRLEQTRTAASTPTKHKPRRKFDGVCQQSETPKGGVPIESIRL